MLRHNLIVFAMLCSILTVWNCTSKSQEEEGLPYLGFSDMVEKEVDGKTVIDTVYHQIADFSFTDQDGHTITNEAVNGKVYVADFFFTTCPTICPIMKTQMLRVYEKFRNNPDFQILSHSIDPTYDTVQVLKDYSERLGIEDASTWHFLTGDQEKYSKLAKPAILPLP